jgi:hypothetical protein
MKVSFVVLLCVLLSSGSGFAQPINRKTHVRSPSTDPAFSDAFLGFHTCDTLTAPNMKKWWRYSPYYAAGIYIGRVHRCRNIPITLIEPSSSVLSETQLSFGTSSGSRSCRA